MEVEDDGPGIPREEIDVLERGEESDLDHLSGLGLWIIHWVVEESNGEIDIKTKPEGTIISIKLESIEYQL